MEISGFCVSQADLCQGCLIEKLIWVGLLRLVIFIDRTLFGLGLDFILQHEHEFIKDWKWNTKSRMDKNPSRIEHEFIKNWTWNSTSMIGYEMHQGLDMEYYINDSIWNNQGLDMKYYIKDWTWKTTSSIGQIMIKDWTWKYPAPNMNVLKNDLRCIKDWSRIPMSRAEHECVIHCTWSGRKAWGCHENSEVLNMCVWDKHFKPIMWLL